jgi:hypothetical protein
MEPLACGVLERHWHANSLILHVGMIWGRDRVGHIS